MYPAIKQVKFFVPGKAQGKQRPKFRRMGNFVKTYTPIETVTFENYVKLQYSNTFPDHFFPAGTPLIIALTAVLPIPESKSKKFKERAKAGLELPTKKPDLDNLAKSVCDALNKTAYADDAQLITMILSKKYGNREGIEISITELTPHPVDFFDN